MLLSDTVGTEYAETGKFYASALQKTRN